MLVLLLAILCPAVMAAEVPEELQRAAPEKHFLEDIDLSDMDGLQEGAEQILAGAAKELRDTSKSASATLVMLLLAVLACAVAEGFTSSIPRGGDFIPIAGALAVTLLSAGELDSLIGLGAETITQLNQFSKALLPTMAAATAASGSVGTAAVHQVATVFFADLLMDLIDGLLMPMTYLYIGTAAAGAMLPDYPIASLAAMLKKAIVWILSGGLLLFTAYLGAAHVIAGSADTLTLRAAKTAIAGMVPVVGGILSEASETVLAGAAVLKNTIGLFGMLAVLSICAVPFFRLGLQYLLYRLAAFLAGTVEPGPIRKLLEDLAGAFGLVLGMCGACALVMLISILASVAAVTI